MTTQKSKFSRSVKECLPSQLKSPTISKHKIMNDQTFPCHCEERSDEAIWVGGQEIATHPAGARNDRTGNEGK